MKQSTQNDLDGTVCKGIDCKSSIILFWQSTEKSHGLTVLQQHFHHAKLWLLLSVESVASWGCLLESLFKNTSCFLTKHQRSSISVWDAGSPTGHYWPFSCMCVCVCVHVCEQSFLQSYFHRDLFRLNLSTTQSILSVDSGFTNGIESIFDTSANLLPVFAKFPASPPPPPPFSFRGKCWQGERETKW